MPEHDSPVVLVVEDERELADLYGEWLADDYAVRIAYDGEEAIVRLDDDIDVVLLDRRMPGLSGDDVLDYIRERDLDCRVAMVTAVEPEFDIVEMGFDDYLVKPVAFDEIHSTVERLLKRATYDERVREYFGLASKKAVLETQRNENELEGSEEYRSLMECLGETRERVDAIIARWDEEDFRAVCREFEGVVE